MDYNELLNLSMFLKLSHPDWPVDKCVEYAKDQLVSNQIVTNAG